MKTITQVAAELGLTLRTIRFYEGRGIVTPQRNGRQGARYYDEAAIERLKEAQKLARYGFSIREIAKGRITRERKLLRFHELLEECADMRKVAGELEAELNGETADAVA